VMISFLSTHRIGQEIPSVKTGFSRAFA